MTLNPTLTAFIRYKEVYPEATEDDMLDEAARAQQVDKGIILPLLGMSKRMAAGEYLLHRQRTGVFVVRSDRYEEDAEAVVTFLAFRWKEQQELAIKLYGGAK